MKSKIAMLITGLVLFGFNVSTEAQTSKKGQKARAEYQKQVQKAEEMRAKAEKVKAEKGRFEKERALDEKELERVYEKAEQAIGKATEDHDKIHRKVFRTYPNWDNVPKFDETIKLLDENGINIIMPSPEAYRQHSERSQNTISFEYKQSIKEGSFKKDLPFYVEKDAHNLSIAVSGTCKEGEIKIDVYMPHGEAYTEILIDEFGSVNWKKSFEIGEDNKEKMGKWVFHINSKNASGRFSISFRTF